MRPTPRIGVLLLLAAISVGLSKALRNELSSEDYVLGMLAIAAIILLYIVVPFDRISAWFRRK